MEESKIVCPKCGSENIVFQAVPKIVKKGKSIFWWIFIGWWWWIVELVLWIFATIPMIIVKLLSQKSTESVTESTAVCQNCGYSWVPENENSKLTRSAKIALTIMFGVFLLFCLIVNAFSGNKKSAAAEATTDPSAIYTQVAQTVIANMTQTAIGDPNAIHTQVAGTMMAQAAATSAVQISTAVPTATIQNYSQLIDYANKKYSQSINCQNIFETLSADFTYISENTDVLFNDTFMSVVYADLDSMKEYCTHFSETSVPAEVSKANDYLKMADQEYLASYNALTYGFKNYDVDSINSAADHMSKATEYLGFATNEFDKVGK